MCATGSSAPDSAHEHKSTPHEFARQATVHDNHQNSKPVDNTTGKITTEKDTVEQGGSQSWLSDGKAAKRARTSGTVYAGALTSAALPYQTSTVLVLLG